MPEGHFDPCVRDSLPVLGPMNAVGGAIASERKANSALLRSGMTWGESDGVESAAKSSISPLWA